MIPRKWRHGKPDRPPPEKVVGSASADKQTAPYDSTVDARRHLPPLPILLQAPTIPQVDDVLPPAVARGVLTNFVPLPTDPTELTAEHARLVFAGDVEGALRELVCLGMER